MIMDSGPIASWLINGETSEKVTDFIFLGSKITVDSDCSPEIKRHLLLGRKAMTKVDSILKTRGISPFSLRKWQPNSSIIAWKILVGYSPWGRNESDKIERLYIDFDRFYSSQSCMDVRIEL